MKNLFLISLFVFVFSCTTETVNQGNPKQENAKAVIPYGTIGLANSPAPIYFWFVLYDVKTKQFIEKEAPKFYSLKENGEKVYTENYISPKWGVVKYDEGATDVDWLAFDNPCTDADIKIAGAFKDHMCFALATDGFKDFYLEWKDKNLGVVNFTFDGYDKHNRAILKEVSFNKKMSKSMTSCGGIYILEVNQ